MLTASHSLKIPFHRQSFRSKYVYLLTQKWAWQYMISIQRYLMLVMCEHSLPRVSARWLFSLPRQRPKTTYGSCAMLSQSFSIVSLRTTNDGRFRAMMRAAWRDMTDRFSFLHSLFLHFFISSFFLYFFISLFLHNLLRLNAISFLQHVQIATIKVNTSTRNISPS